MDPKLFYLSLLNLRSRYNVTWWQLRDTYKYKNLKIRKENTERYEAKTSFKKKNKKKTSWKQKMVNTNTPLPILD